LWNKKKIMNKTEEFLAKGALVIDVRSVREFDSGHADNSINIPLHEIMDRVAELKQMGKPLILCCRTGNRSGTACSYLSAEGIECINAGSWQEVQEAMGTQA
jgi:rhodanese-related sulfurtransferase